ncbi:Spo0B domain-containing protein [Paenibacillus mendelii]|uniref:Spo0B domain-containing protein n=1 Tax=Paenibacillus mendelii TaxID=206163 RepID=A0ABV6JA99_9BACL|nr:Spo0B domain-containing protein [Paenibacillus mendelii]MCQ6560873.1 sporulation initiation phosphotransferase B [Paenibacillus mendelii]
MNRIRTMKHYAAASILLPAASVLIWRSELWLLAVFIGWVAAAAVLWVWCERQEQSNRMSRMTHALQTASIRTLNHHRHDWMNDLQVLYGYIRMGKADRSVQCVEQIRDRMVTESKIAKLGIPSLVTYIQSFRTMTNSLLLEVDIDGELNLSQLPLDGERVSNAIVEIINVYRFAIKPGLGEVAKLTVELDLDEKGLQLAFLFEGEIGDVNEWQQKWRQRVKDTPLQPLGAKQLPEQLLLQAELGN